MLRHVVVFARRARSNREPPGRVLRRAPRRATSRSRAASGRGSRRISARARAARSRSTAARSQAQERMRIVARRKTRKHELAKRLGTRAPSLRGRANRGASARRDAPPCPRSSARLGRSSSPVSFERAQKSKDPTAELTTMPRCDDSQRRLAAKNAIVPKKHLDTARTTIERVIVRDRDTRCSCSMARSRVRGEADQLHRGNSPDRW